MSFRSQDLDRSGGQGLLLSLRPSYVYVSPQGQRDPFDPLLLKDPQAEALWEKIQQPYRNIPLSTLEIKRFCANTFHSEIDLDRYDAFIVTSSAALLALEPLVSVEAKLQGKPVFIVGEATAERAEKIGFSVQKKFQDVQALVDFFKGKENSFSSWSFLYCRGQKVRCELPQKLPQVRIEELYCYENVFCTTLPSSLENALKAQKVSDVLFFSRETAVFFGKLIKRAQLEHTLVPIKALVLSKAIETVLEPLPFKEVFCVEDPSIRGALRFLVDRVQEIDLGS